MDLFSLSPNPLTEYLHDPDNFVFGMMLEKSETSRDGKLWIQGIASAEIKDQAQESVIQKGMDCQPLLESGSINWDHHDDRGPAYLIGEPTDVEIVSASKFAEKLGGPIPGPAMFVRGFLYNDPVNKPISSAAWQHLNTADVSPGRQLRWSVQGRILKRDDLDSKRIVKSEVRHLALTHQPVQRYTFAEIAKSLSTESAAPLLRENLPGSKQWKQVMYGDCKKGCYDDEGKFRKGIAGAIEHLHECRGRDIYKSQKLLMSLHEHGYPF